MAYYYVKTDGVNDGTKTTGSLTKQTGSFATLGVSSYYATIELAITGGAAAGDFICVSDLHAFSTAAAITYTGPAGGESLHILTVDDSNCDAQASVPASPQEQTTGAADITVVGRISFYSVYIKTDDNWTASNASESVFYTSIIEITDNLTWANDAATVEFRNAELKYVDTASQLAPSSGGTLRCYGGSTTATSFLTNGGFNNGGGDIVLCGFDLSTITGSIFNATGNDFTGDDSISIAVKGCKINASSSWLSETLEGQDQRLIATNCSSSSAAAEYAFYVEAYGGSVEDQDDTGVHRDESTAFPGGTKVSLKCVATADATQATPFWFDFPTRYAELSATATDTIRIYLTSTTNLYDSTVWAELLYPDGTTKQLYNLLSTRHDNILDTNGTALTTDTGSTWKNGAADLTVGTEYYIDLDTSVAPGPGADCVPIIRMYVATAATIYFDTSVDLTTG